MYRVQVSSFEEPCAVIPHAGICEGAVGQLAVLPRLCYKKYSCGTTTRKIASSLSALYDGFADTSGRRVYF